MAKLQKYKASSGAIEGKQLVPEKTMSVVDAKKNLKELENKQGDQEVENKSSNGKRGRGKRKLSSDGGVSQEKKIARKSGDFNASLPSENQVQSTDQSASKSRKKRGREDDNDQAQENASKGRRLSTRLQKKKTSQESEGAEDTLPQAEDSSNRKKRKRTTDPQQDVAETSDLSKDQEKTPNMPLISNNDKPLVENFVSDMLWTELYRPVHSTEVMANASAVSKLRSWLEEWKIKREKTLRKELQQQKRYCDSCTLFIQTFSQKY